MKLNRLGSTDIFVSAIGLGTVKFGRNTGVKYPKAFELPSDQDILNLVSKAKSFGINLLDTAPAYGLSEEHLGKLIHRNDWILCSKTGENFSNGESSFYFSKEETIKSVERSLKRLNTDYLDILLVHSNGEDTKIIREDHIFEVLEKLKQSGKIRAYGMSTKTIEGGKLAIDLSDVAMVTYNPLETADREVISYAHQKNKGIFIKKGFASGHLQKIPGNNPVKTSMDFIFQEIGVTSIILGTLNSAHLTEAVEYSPK